MIVRTTFTNVALLVCNFATGLLAARFLEAEGRGQFALIVLYPQLVCYVSMFGLDRSLAIVVGQKLAARPARTVLLWALATAVLGVAGTIGCVWIAIEPEWLRNLALAFCAYIPAFQIYTLFVAAHMGRGDFHSYNRSRTVFYVSYLLLILAGVAVDRVSVYSFAFAYAVATGIGAAASVVMFVRKREDPPDEEAAETADAPPKQLDWRGIAALNLPFMVPAVLYAFAATIDRVIVSIWLDARTLGIFVVYLGYVQMVTPVANAVNATVFHRSLAKGETKDLALVVRLSSLVYIALLLTLGAMASFLINLLYGPSFATELTAAYILLGAGFFLFASQVLNEHLKGQRSTMQDVLSNGIYLVMLIGTAVLLVGKYRIQGLAVAVGLANLGRYLTVAAYFRKRVGFGLRTITIPRLADLAVGWGLCRGLMQSALKAGRR